MLMLLAAMLLVLPATDSTPPRPLGQLVHTRWTAKEGAPADIQTLAQTPDGYLWLGTGTGLFRFDGVRFAQFTPRGGDTLPGTGISRLMTTRDGSLWIVWPSGAVSRLRDGRVTSYGERDGLPPAFQITESSRGVLLAGTTKGLARFADGKWEDLGLAWGLSDREGHSVWFDRNDVLWVQTLGRIVYLPPGAPQFVDPRMIVVNRAARADFAQEPDGTVWMNELSRSAHTLRHVDDALPPSEVRVRSTSVLIDRKGSLWIGTAGDGLRRVIDPTKIRGKAVARNGPEAEQLTMKDGLLSDIVNALLEDREGNVWVASSGGLERFRHGAFTPMAPMNPERARFLFAARDSSLWTAAQDMKGVARITSRDSATIPTDFLITNLAQDSTGAIYTARAYAILKYDGRGFAQIPLKKTDFAIALMDITVDPAGTIWVFDAESGLMRLNGDSLIRVARMYQAAARFGALFSDRKGLLWVGQLNRIALYDHGRTRFFGAAEGVPAGLVFQLMEDPAGILWAVGDGGISRFENGRFRTIAERSGIPGRKVFGVAEDAGGAWWMVTRAGVLRMPAGEAARALADSTYSIRFRTFDQQDGLPGRPTVGNWGSPITRTADGKIWVATDSGVASVDPRNLPREAQTAVLIESVRIDGRVLAPSDSAPIPAGRRDLEIDYTVAGLTSPDKAQFRYRLEGEDTTWRDVGAQRRVVYKGLGAGNYRFRVATKNGEGVWDEQGSAWTFRVLPPWYETLWFGGTLVIVIGALGGLAAAIIQRSRHVREQKALKGQYEATLAERGRIAQDLHDTLLQGFIGVTLQLRAAELALPGKPELAGETIRQVQRLARESLREARERVWDMRGTAMASADLPAALEAVARERASGTGIEVSATVVGKRRRLARKLEDAAFRIGREAVANAIRHADAKRIDIEVKFGDALLSLEVRDDGRGFSPEEAEDARRQGHFGLSGVRERAVGLGGRCEVYAKPGGGTIVALELPLMEASSEELRQ